MIEEIKFKFVAGHAFMRSHRLVPEKAGVYAIFIRGGESVLTALNYFGLGGVPAWSIGSDYYHVYTGASGSMRDRIKKHALGDANVSPLRKSLLAGESWCGAIAATGFPLPAAANDEYALDFWLAANSVFAFSPQSDPFGMESRLLDSTASPLNITGRRATPFSRKLMALRSIYDGRAVQPFCQEALSETAPTLGLAA